MENNNQFKGRRPLDTNQQWIYGYDRYTNRYGEKGDYGRVNYNRDNDVNRGYRNKHNDDYLFSSHGNYGFGSHGAFVQDYGYTKGNVPDQYGPAAYGNQYNRNNYRNLQPDERYRSGEAYGYGANRGNRFEERRGGYGTDYQNQGYASSIDYSLPDYGTSGNSYISGSVFYGYPQNNRTHPDRDWLDRTRDEVASWLGDDEARRRRRMDEQYAGTHSGKGPKGYHRSEERIREDVCDRLSDDLMVDASDISVEVKGHDVILSGHVQSKSEKRRAEDLVESISGVKHVENRLRVNLADDWGSRL